MRRRRHELPEDEREELGAKLLDSLEPPRAIAPSAAATS